MKRKRLPLPKQITVFSKTYKIKYCRKLISIDRDNKHVINKDGSINEKKAIFGNIDFIKHEIKIYKGKGYPLEEVWHYIIHEWNHIIEREMNMDFKKMSAEDIVDSFAMGTAHILIENDIYVKGTLKRKS